MAEHINAEIALATLNNTELVCEWVKSTYLWVRIQKNPSHYGVDTKTVLVAEGLLLILNI